MKHFMKKKNRAILKKFFRGVQGDGEKIRFVQFEELQEIIRSGVSFWLVDTRSPQEFSESKLEYAINIPDYEIPKKAFSLLPNKDGLIVLYCQSGERSRKAYLILSRLGYSNLYDLEGGLDNI